MRILVVEDEVELASYLKRGLEREGFAVDVAGDGDLGLQMAMTNAYQALVLDIMLPKLNGYRVCAELRAQSNWVPILMLTAKDGEYDEAEALDTGADDYLTKPFSFVVLVAHLRALMRRGTGARPAVLSLGDMTLDPATRTFAIDDDPVAFYVPLVEATFVTVHRAATRTDLRMRYSSMRAPRVLDLGAGGAPWSIAVLEACPDAVAVVNDLPGVIDVARRKSAEHGVAERCEFRSGDFHELDLEPESYDLVVLGHVCRTEGEAGARTLIERAFAALAPEGRIIVADYFVDNERKFNPHGVLMGTTMMASTINGFTITCEQAAEWLRGTGFEAVRLIEPIGFQFAYIASKPRTIPEETQS